VLIGLPSAATAQENEEGPRGTALYFEQGYIDPQPLPGGNAAIEWYRLWDQFGGRTWMLFEDAGCEHTFASPISPERRAFIEKHQRYLDDAAEVARIKLCDWGHKLKGQFQGRAFPLQLFFLRPTERMLFMDAQRAAEEGRMTVCTERLCAALRASRHLTLGADVGVTLQGARACAASCNAIVHLLDKGKLEPAHARKLLAALREYPEPDPFNVGGAFEFDAGYYINWLRTMTGERPLDQFTARSYWTVPNTNFQIDFVRSFTQDKFQADIDRLERYYEILARAARGRAPFIQLEVLEEEAQEGQHGIIAFLARPAFDTYIRELMPPFINTRRMTIERLERLVAREESPAVSE
jgi:hypothetical protein